MHGICVYLNNVSIIESVDPIYRDGVDMPIKP